jgi:peptide/nickel transport system ATP-binding protein
VTEPVLRVERLTTAFRTERGYCRAVDDVSFEIYPGRTLALVGESGAGKSVTALSLLRLLPTPPAQFERGRVLFGDVDLLAAPERHLRAVRGAGIALVFQEPLSALSPARSIGAQLFDVLRQNGGPRGGAARARGIELLERVGVPAPATRLRAFPQELSGGARQQVMIAMALAAEPRVLVADDPTAALDVTVQAQILDLLRRQQQERGLGVLLVTHDLGVVAEAADEVAVMFAGQVVERAPTTALFSSPRHPYTRALLRVGAEADAEREARGRRRADLTGTAPSPGELDAGCRYAERCALLARREPEATSCRRVSPELRALGGDRWVRCPLAEEEP